MLVLSLRSAFLGVLQENDRLGCVFSREDAVITPDVAAFYLVGQSRKALVLGEVVIANQVPDSHVV
jgi:hypothetical protein